MRESDDLFKRAQGNIVRAEENITRAQETRAKFVESDLDLAMTIAHNALSSPEGSDRRERNAQTARRAYKVLSGYEPEVVAEPHDKKRIHRKITELRELLGELEKKAE